MNFRIPLIAAAGLALAVPQAVFAQSGTEGYGQVPGVPTSPPAPPAPPPPAPPPPAPAVTPAAPAPAPAPATTPTTTEARQSVTRTVTAAVPPAPVTPAKPLQQERAGALPLTGLDLGAVVLGGLALLMLGLTLRRYRDER
jgi:hypothetical protein